jgi:hypothetical protein
MVRGISVMSVGIIVYIYIEQQGIPSVIQAKSNAANSLQWQETHLFIAWAGENLRFNRSFFIYALHQLFNNEESQSIRQDR